MATDRNNQSNQQNDTDRGTGAPRDGRDRDTQTNQSNDRNNNRNDDRNDNRNTTSSSQSNQQSQQSQNQSRGTDENGYPLNQDGSRDERHYDHGQGDVIDPQNDGRLKENRGGQSNTDNNRGN